jgi:hypothetical protein
MGMPDGDDISMTMWMKGSSDRTVFSALSPMCEGLSREPGMPYSVKDQPTLTFVARQQGEAWTKPFVAVFEPSSMKEPSNIASVSFFDAKTQAKDFAGICVKNKSGRTDYIFTSGSTGSKATYSDMSSDGTYSIVGMDDQGKSVLLFLGNGQKMQAGTILISSDKKANVLLEKKLDHWYYTSTEYVNLQFGKKKWKLRPSVQMQIIDF